MFAHRLVITYICFSLLPGKYMSAQTKAFPDTLTMKELRYTVYCLASDSLGGRLAGSSDDLKTSTIISRFFKEIHLQPACGKSYFQEFDFPGDSGRMMNSRNVVGRCGNEKGHIILIGAHYDHIGMGGGLSRNPLKHEVHNGADDNASGVAVMLELARMLSMKKRLKNNYVFAAFSAHENGLYGSSYLAGSGLLDTSRIALMINLDMVGRWDSISRKLFFGCNCGWCDTLIMQIRGTRLLPAGKELPSGDHSAFDSDGIPVMYFTTGTHDDYHKVSDDPELIIYKGMVEIVRFLFTVANTIEKNGIPEKEENLY